MALYMIQVLEDSNHYNWRLRDAFAAQLPRLIPLFPASTVFDVILPLTFALLEDPVFRVRTTTYRAIATLHACEYVLLILALLSSLLPA